MIHIFNSILTALSLSESFMIVQHSTFLILEQSCRTHKNCCSLAVTKPKGRSAPQCIVQFFCPCCLGTYWNSHLLLLVLPFFSSVWKEYVVCPYQNSGKYCQTSLNGHWFLISVTLSPLVLISPVFTRNKSLIWWVVLKLSLFPAHRCSHHQECLVDSLLRHSRTIMCLTLLGLRRACWVLFILPNIQELIIPQKNIVPFASCSLQCHFEIWGHWHLNSSQSVTATAWKSKEWEKVSEISMIW